MNIKTYLIIALASTLTHVSFDAKAVSNSKIVTKPVQDSLAAYYGKYEMKRGSNAFYIQVTSENGELIFTELWDKQKKQLKHLSADSYIVSGLDWSVKFLRDKDGKVKEVVVMGTDHWLKVE